MSVFQDIDAVVKTVSTIGKDASDVIGSSTGLKVDRHMRSISQASTKSIYYFPILMSKNVQPSTMGLISQNLEGSYMSFVKACFALTPAMNLKNADLLNVEDYLRLFHQNIGLQDKDELMLSMRESMQEYSMFPNDTLNEANGSNINGILGRYGSFGTTSDSNKKLVTIGKTTKSPSGDIKYNSSSQKYVDDDAQLIHNREDKYDKNGKLTSTTITSDYISSPKKKIFINQNAIRDEVESKNSFRPSVIEVEVTFIISNQPIKINIPVGVKTVIHAVNSEDLINHIMDSVAGKGLLHNLIRYTTGELHSLSDILFGTSQIKKNIARSNDVTRWADALERRKNSNKIRNVIPFLQKKPYLPNTSIVISMEDISEIERVVGYNLLTDIKRTVKFMKDNFILTFVVADDVTETVYVLYDGHTKFAEFPFSTIKRENNKNEDIVNALIKGIGMGRTV